MAEQRHTSKRQGVFIAVRYHPTTQGPNGRPWLMLDTKDGHSGEHQHHHPITDAPCGLTEGR